MRKSLKLDKPSHNPQVVQNSHILTGELLRKTPGTENYAEVKLNTGEIVNVPMSDVIAAEGARVKLFTSPSGSINRGEVIDARGTENAGTLITFGTMSSRLLEDRESINHAQSRLDQLHAALDARSEQLKTELAESKQRITEAREKLDQTTAELDRLGDEAPAAIKLLRQRTEEINQAQAQTAAHLNQQIDATKDQITTLMEASKHAVSLADDARAAALQAAGLVDSRGRTITQFDEPTDPRDTKTNNVWIQPIQGKSAKTYIWDEPSHAWKEIDDDGVQRAAQAALDAMTTASAAEVKAGDAITKADVAKTYATEAGRVAASAQTQAGNASNAAADANYSAREARSMASAAGNDATQARSMASAAGNDATQARNLADAASNDATQARSLAGAASNDATQARSLASAASNDATQARSLASAASNDATQALTEARKAPRHVSGSSLSAGKAKITRPYRNGDTVAVGSGSPFKISESYRYDSGNWIKELIRAENLYIDNAGWIRLLAADRGDIANLFVKDTASIRRLFVAGRSHLKDVIVGGTADIANAIIGKIKADDINALNIKAASLDLGERVKADRDGIRIFNVNPDNDPDAYVVTQLSGEEQAVGITKNGTVVGGFNSDGDLTAQDATINSLDVNQLTVGGLSLNEVIDLPEPPPSTKVVARVDGDLDYKGIGGRHEAKASVWIAEFQIHNDSNVGRMYALHTSSITIINGTTLPRLAEFKANINTSWTPARQAAENAPTVDVVSTMLYSGNYASAGLHGMFMLAAHAYANVVVRVSATAEFVVKNTPFSGYVLDMGESVDYGNARMVGYSTDREYGGQSQPGQITYVPPVPPVPPKPRERTWAATSFRTFIQSASENTSRDRSLPDRTDARSNRHIWAGLIPNASLARRDGSTKGIAVLGNGVARTLNGAEIKRVMVYVRIEHGYYGAGNKVRIYPGKTGDNWGRYGNSYREVTLSRGQGTWVDMTSQFKHGLEHGYITNIAFDPDGSRDRHYYTKIVDARLKVTYTS